MYIDKWSKNRSII